jgi:hypothetical protein
MTDDTQPISPSSTNSVQDTSSGQNFWQWSQDNSGAPVSRTTWWDTSNTLSSITTSQDPTINTGAPVLNIDQLAPASYVPSEFERKRAVVMYFLIGIVMTLQSDSPISAYEWFHLQQSLGRWAFFSVIVFIIIIYIAIFFFVVWFMFFLPAIFLFLYLMLRGYFVYQAWKGIDVTNPNTKIILPVFSDVGSWLLGIFEISKK